MCINCNSESENLTEVDEQYICESCLENLPTCDSCGDPALELSGLANNSDEYCNSCYNELPTCSYCEERVLEVDDNNHCLSCESEFEDCFYCNSNFHRDNLVEDFDFDYVCESCQEDGTIPRDSDYWYRYSDLHQHNDGEWYICPEPNIIKKYHGSQVERIRTSNSGTYAGFELEIIPTSDRYDLAKEVCEFGNLHCEEDSSLDEDGFEIISNYGDIDDVLHIASKLSNLLNGNAISHETSCCGLHIHLTRSNDFDNAKMIVFWNDPDNRKFIKLFTRRESKDYAAFNNEKNKKTLPKSDYDKFNQGPDRYQAVIVTCKGTLEVRAFKGTIKKETLLACIELAYYSYEYCKQVNSGEELTYQRFLDWLSNKDSKHIFNYLEEKKFESEPEPVFDPNIESEPEPLFSLNYRNLVIV